MKTVETKTSSTASNQIQKKQQPFFNKGGEGSFFSKSNEATQSFFSPSIVQAKLTIGQPNDKYEVEADAMADKVVQRLSQPENNSISSTSSGTVQRQCSSCEEEEKLQKKEDLLDKETNAVQLKPIFESNSEETNVQAKLINTSIVQTKCATCDQEEYVLRKEEEELPDNDQLLQRKGIDTPSENTSNLESRLNSSKGGGRSLPSDLQTSMGSEFGADFSKVKIHTGSEAVQMSQDIGAQAFTHGSDIYFNQGKYDTNSNSGKHLLAHELTHTVQQGASDVTPSVQKLSWDDVRQAGSSALSSAGRGLTNIGGAISDTVSSGVDTVRNVGASFMRTTLNQYAPGLWDLLTNGVDAELKRRIFQSVMRVVRNLKTQIENSDLVGKIRDFFSNSKVKLKQWKNEVADKCNTLYEKIDALVSFFGDMTDPVIQQIRLGLQTLGGYASAFWDNIGKPAWEAIRQFAGDAWDWLQSTARWIWDRTEGIRQLFVDIWEWIKTQLGLLQDSATSIWDRFKEIAAEVWEEIKSYIEPVLQPLKVLGGLMLAFSPLGPIVAIYQAGPRIWESLKWVVTNWSGWQTLIDLKDQFANEILPAISRGAQQAKLHLQQAVTWVNGIVTSVKQAVKDFLNSIGILQVVDEVRGFMAELRLLFNQIKAEFDSLYTSLKEDFNAVMTLAKDLLQSLWECVRPILDFVLGIVALVINPFMWPVYAVALITRLAWFFLPRDLKIVAIDFVIELLRGAVEYLRPSGVPEQIWIIFRSGAVSFLNRLDGYTPDEKINFVNKILNLLIDPRTYGAWMRGLIGGFLHQAWTLVSGVISLGIEMPSIIQGIINFFRNLVPDVQMLERMLDRITELSMRIQELLARGNLLQYIINTVMNSPQVLVDWISETTGEAANFAENTGREMAEGLFTYVNTMTSSGVGYKIGDIIGRILFEVLLTKGIGFVIGKITQGIAWFRRILGMLRSGARNAARGLLQRAKELFTWVMDKMRTLFQRLGEALGRIFASFKRLIDDIIAWIMRAIRGGGRMLGDIAQNRLRWELFERSVGLFTSAHRNPEGFRRSVARNMFRNVFTGFRDVARMPRLRSVRVANDPEYIGLWELRAVKKFGVNRLGSHVVGHLAMPRRMRYEENPVIGMTERLRRLIGRHRFIIEGNLNRPEPVVRSRRRTLNRLLNRRREELYNSDNEETNLESKRRAVNELFQQKRVLGRGIARYKSAVDDLYRESGRARIVNEAYDEVRTVFPVMARNLEIIGLDPEADLPETNVTFNTEGNRAKEMLAEPLTRIPGNTRGQTPSQYPLGWSLIDVNLRRSGAWVRAHMLSHRLHGPGTRNNLFPGTRHMNLDNMESRVERPLKNLVWNRGKVMYYRVSLTYGNTGTFEDIPTRVFLEYGEYNPRTRRRSRTRRRGYNQDPPDAAAVLNSINRSTATDLNRIARNNGHINMGNFFRVLVRERRANGNYVAGDFDDIKDRLRNSNAYVTDSILNRHVNNLESMVNNTVLIF
ncbi:DUF4157 domain-containing protein [uncultured Psychroserpens sp.]|uniref:eCIS core domain-containing protein n=1 Tax=uncultured Psychroserpens sp. TaxID=255436 RepID=UPI0026229C7A|nr:DUF4157 domain-containing protein [uncultured Psychroserpens sp.]